MIGDFIFFLQAVLCLLYCLDSFTKYLILLMKTCGPNECTGVETMIITLVMGSCPAEAKMQGGPQ